MFSWDYGVMGAVPAPLSSGGMVFGSSQYAAGGVATGPHASLNWEKTQAWTAIAKIKVASAPGSAAIIFTTCNQGVSTTGITYAGYEFWINSTGVLQVRIIHTVSTNWISVFGTTNVCDGKQHTVAATYSGSGAASGVSLYVDGVLETPNTEGDTLTGTIIANQPVWMGDQLGWPYGLGGTLYNFVLSNVVRSTGWISAFNTAAAAVDANTVLAYDFLEGSGNTTVDLSGNHFNAAVNGATWAATGQIGKAPYWRQGAISANSSATTTSVTATFSTGALAGSAVLGGFLLANTGAGSAISVSDNQGNAYTVSQTNASFAGVLFGTFYSLGVTNSPTAVTVKISSGVGSFFRMLADEIVNLSTHGLDQQASLYTSAVTSNTTDAASSGAFSATSPSEFIYGVGAHYTLLARMFPGTNFTNLVSASSADAAATIYSEYQWLTSTTTVAATYTVSTTTAPVQVHVGGMGFKTR